MNKLIILLIVFSLNISHAQSIQDVRRLYIESSYNDSKLDSLNHLLEEKKIKPLHYQRITAQAYC